MVSNGLRWARKSYKHVELYRNTLHHIWGGGGGGEGEGEGHQYWYMVTGSYRLPSAHTVLKAMR